MKFELEIDDSRLHSMVAVAVKDYVHDSHMLKHMVRQAIAGMVQEETHKIFKGNPKRFGEMVLEELKNIMREDD